MVRNFILLFLLLLTVSCAYQPDYHSANWKVLESEPDNSLFACGMELYFSGKNLTVETKGNRLEYNFVWVGDQIAVRSTFSDWLFKTEPGSGDTLYLYEQYKARPMRVKLLKISKPKKNKS